ncbi:YbaB/EbfC family nucleoid-associated protein [Nocardia sp. NPDC049149]|uniref:YbaB/EbfC family nucleoid-associated protein n=1 Tax=Nocardia sp. NPDC049149 TaxID=3364315 RepID=UPI0037127F86
MTNERRKDDLAEALEGLQRHVQLVTELQERRAQLVGIGTVRDEYVTVTVNADNAVIQTKFSDDIGELSFDEIAEAVTEAAQAAIADVTRKVQRLVEPVTANQRTMPSLEEMVESLTGVHTEIPDPPPAIMVPPKSGAAESDSVATISGGGYEEQPRPRRVTGTTW